MYHPELSAEEKLLSYSKYYYLDPEPTNPLALQLLRKPLDKEDVLWPENVEEMFKPGYQDAMLGYYIFNGGSYSTIYMQLHDVSIDMIDWWFTWLYLPPKSVPREQGNLRYKIWCPADHFDHYPEDEESEARLCNEDISMQLRRQGVRLGAVESIDMGKSGEKKLMHMYLNKHDSLALPQECWDYIHSIGTLNVGSSDHSVTLQFFRKTSYGCEIIIRMWRGYILNEEGKIVRTQGYATPAKEHIMNDMIHNLCEMPHLEKFLPQLYAEEGKKPVGAY